jgi:hypothetical protein
MNRHEQAQPPQDEAKLSYGPVEFQVVRPGVHVRCAVTGRLIRLEDLKYWSVAFQEPYASPEAVMARLERSQATHL